MLIKVQLRQYNVHANRFASKCTPGGAAAGLPTPLPLPGGLPMRDPRLPLPVAGRGSSKGSAEQPV